MGRRSRQLVKTPQVSDIPLIKVKKPKYHFSREYAVELSFVSFTSFLVGMILGFALACFDIRLFDNELTVTQSLTIVGFCSFISASWLLIHPCQKMFRLAPITTSAVSRALSMSNSSDSETVSEIIDKVKTNIKLIQDVRSVMFYSFKKRLIRYLIRHDCGDLVWLIINKNMAAMDSVLVLLDHRAFYDISREMIKIGVVPIKAFQLTHADEKLSFINTFDMAIELTQEDYNLYALSATTPNEELRPSINLIFLDDVKKKIDKWSDDNAIVRTSLNNNNVSTVSQKQVYTSKPTVPAPIRPIK